MVEDLATSQARAAARLARAPAGPRRKRADAGRLRFAAQVVAELGRLAFAEDLAPDAALEQLRVFCRKHRQRCPSRASVYQMLRKLPLPSLRMARLPASVTAALYNLEGVDEVPADQVAFCCFNFGDTAAMSFASGLPVIALTRALAMRGWRPKSRSVAEAVLRVRRSDARRRAGDPRGAE